MALSVNCGPLLTLNLPNLKEVLKINVKQGMNGAMWLNRLFDADGEIIKIGFNSPRSKQ